MKNLSSLIIILSIFSIMSCQNNSVAPDKEKKYFDSKELSSLSLENISDFWGNDSLSSFSNYFKNYPGYKGGAGLRAVKKSIGVAVFESEEKAIISMEGRMNIVSIVITLGIPNEILKGKWWFSGSPTPAVFVNQWNTIIEVAVFEANYEEVKTLLIETAAEIARRIDSLSQ